MSVEQRETAQGAIVLNKPSNLWLKHAAIRRSSFKAITTGVRL